MSVQLYVIWGISWMPPIKPVFYMVFITSLFISLKPTSNFGNQRNLPVIAWFSDIQGHLYFVVSLGKKRRGCKQPRVSESQGFTVMANSPFVFQVTKARLYLLGHQVTTNSQRLQSSHCHRLPHNLRPNNIFSYCSYNSL